MCMYDGIMYVSYILIFMKQYAAFFTASEAVEIF
jgi:hypothetical protein